MGEGLSHVAIDAAPLDGRVEVGEGLSHVAIDAAVGGALRGGGTAADRLRVEDEPTDETAAVVAALLVPLGC